MKTAGIILTLVSSFAAAFLTVRKELLHCKHLTATIRYLEYIKGQAEHYSDSFSSIIQSSEYNDISDKFTFFLNNGNSATAAWEYAVDETSLILSKEERQIITNFGLDLCSSSVENLAENANKSISELEKIRDNLVTDREKKTKMSSVLALSSGLVAVLMFI